MPVPMPMMNIGIVGMAVPYGVVDVPVRVGLARWLGAVVGVVMVVIVHVAMLMREPIVVMLVLMPFGQMQPDSERHQPARRDQLRRDRLSQEDHGRDPTEERGQGEVGAGAGGSHVS